MSGQALQEGNREEQFVVELPAVGAFGEVRRDPVLLAVTQLGIDEAAEELGDLPAFGLAVSAHDPPSIPCANTLPRCRV